MPSMTTETGSEPLLSAVRRVASPDKIVRNRMLNRLGCQVGRVVAAEALLRLRRRRLAGERPAPASVLIRDGVTCIPDFVSRDDFVSLLAEADRAEAKLFTKRPVADKFGIVRLKVAVRKNPDLFPVAMRTLLGSDLLLRMARVAEGWSDRDDFTNRETALTYERLEQELEPTDLTDARDDEISSGDMHTDTFHYVTKAFLTLDDVTAQNSPYTYAPGSHRLTLARLAWEYRNSVRPEQYRTGEYHNRLWEHEQQQLGIAAEPLEVPRNTLIVTNTFGFHRRGPMTVRGAVRRMLRVDFRSNPFVV
jgi:hypothetical protein